MRHSSNFAVKLQIVAVSIARIDRRLLHAMSAAQSSLLFVIVGRNEPIFETEIHKRGTIASVVSDAMARQNYFVLHSALDLVDKAAWTSNNMYLKVVDKVTFERENPLCIAVSLLTLTMSASL
jgi:Sedlin, N-terminal conserved region